MPGASTTSGNPLLAAREAGAWRRKRAFTRRRATSFQRQPARCPGPLEGTHSSERERRARAELLRAQRRKSWPPGLNDAASTATAGADLRKVEHRLRWNPGKLAGDRAGDPCRGSRRWRGCSDEPIHLHSAGQAKKHQQRSVEAGSRRHRSGGRSSGRGGFLATVVTCQPSGDSLLSGRSLLWVCHPQPETTGRSVFVGGDQTDATIGVPRAAKASS